MSNSSPFAPPGSRIWTGSRGMSMLLALLICAVFVVPILAHIEWVGVLVADVVLTLTLLTGIAATSARRARPVLAAMAVVALALRWAPWVVPALSAPVVREAASLATFALLAAIVAREVFKSGEVTTNRVMGAVVLYLLLGLCWAMIYNLVALADSRAFIGGNKDGGGPQHWVYFSFVTLTTVGFGDITPVAPVARSLAVLEALVGQLYPAILLGRLVSLQVQTSGESR